MARAWCLGTRDPALTVLSSKRIRSVVSGDSEKSRLLGYRNCSGHGSIPIKLPYRKDLANWVSSLVEIDAWKFPGMELTVG